MLTQDTSAALRQERWCCVIGRATTLSLSRSLTEPRVVLISHHKSAGYSYNRYPCMHAMTKLPATDVIYKYRRATRDSTESLCVAAVAFSSTSSRASFWASGQMFQHGLPCRLSIGLAYSVRAPAICSVLVASRGSWSQHLNIRNSLPLATPVLEPTRVLAGSCPQCRSFQLLFTTRSNGHGVGCFHIGGLVGDKLFRRHKTPGARLAIRACHGAAAPDP